MIKTKTNRPIIIVGKNGTGKTTKALDILPDNPIIRYAYDYNIEDNFSIPLDRGILIEEAHYKPKIDLIIKTFLEYKGPIVLTSVNQKNVPKKIYDMCKLKRAGTVNYAYAKLQNQGCMNADEPFSSIEKNIFEMINLYLRSKNRDEVANVLKFNKPYDEQILSWIMSSLRTEKIAWIDSKVKRKWSSDYFYELVAFAHQGAPIPFTPPKRRAYDKRPVVARKIGLKSDQYHLIDLLKQDSDFEKFCATKLSAIDRRLIGVKKPIKTKRKKTVQKTLEDW